MILCSCSCSPKCSLPISTDREFSNFFVITENLCAWFNSTHRMTNLQQGRRRRADREAAQSVLPSISAILGQQQLPNVTMSRVDFSISPGTKFLLKISPPQRPLDAAGYLHRATISAGGGEGGQNIRIFQCLISPAAGWCAPAKRSKCAPHRLQGV